MEAEIIIIKSSKPDTTYHPDRRIRCTKELPVCHNCSKSGRFCKRQAFPLSWPRQGDTRRSVLAKGPSGGEQDAAWHFINVSAQEVALSTPYNQGAHILMNGPTEKAKKKVCLLAVVSDISSLRETDSFWDDGSSESHQAVVVGIGRYLSPLPELAQNVDDPSLFTYCT
jgi:hypothetical protein